MNAACTGYCGGHHPTEEMWGTDDGKMCDECHDKLLDAQREYIAEYGRAQFEQERCR